MGYGTGMSRTSYTVTLVTAAGESDRIMGACMAEAEVTAELTRDATDEQGATVIISDNHGDPVKAWELVGARWAPR